MTYTTDADGRYLSNKGTREQSLIKNEQFHKAGVLDTHRSGVIVMINLSSFPNSSSLHD